uniref:Uncharacterized protein n=1 Tax=mine drainage metagenome TaxID=410659 RepID=E6QJG2_9ZZZZ
MQAVVQQNAQKRATHGVHGIRKIVFGETHAIAPAFLQSGNPCGPLRCGMWQ